VKIPLSWLREWVSPPPEWTARDLGDRLTQAGFEVEALILAAEAFHGVVVAKILSVEPHPEAQKLQVCQVSVGDQADGSPTTPLQIVCGAANARAGLVTALATIGAVLPGDKKIGQAKLRGVDSHGMLCSARELSISDDSSGILELPSDAPLGIDLRKYLDLDDVVLELNVTPNRGDAMSVLGIAREVAALAETSLKGAVASSTGSLSTTALRPVPNIEGGSIALHLEPHAGAARLLARVVTGVDNTRTSPLWLRERLRRAGLRSISPIVDVTNYVMLELGQPLHAYDKARLHGGLTARRAHSGDTLTLLDGREVILDPDVLVIADDRAPIGMAGIMGGAGTAISAQTVDVVLEAAWFKPAVIAGRARRFGLFTDAAQRFERGVDWRGQERALQLAKRLILDIAGGSAQAVVTAELPEELPLTHRVPLRYKRLERLLGISVAPSQVEQRLRSLGLEVSAQEGGWSVTPPSWRFDLAIEVDLIEEVGRVGGLDAIEEQEPKLTIMPRPLPADRVDGRAVLRTLAGRGYQEIITFGFVDPAMQRVLFSDAVAREQTIELVNPISSDLAVMRSSLWPGLISVARTNLQRQQSRMRLFEIAHRFVRDGDQYREWQSLAGLALGARLPEQWGTAATPVDFFDVKEDLEALFALRGKDTSFRFEPGALECLHPGRSAKILQGERVIGYVGELHPNVVCSFNLTYAPIVFELDYLATFGAKVAQFREVSRFPQIRRDISVTVPVEVAYAALRERVSLIAGGLLQQIGAFDLYQGKGVEIGRKSVALGLILQDLSRTLTDDDADRIVHAVLADLQSSLDARIRE
jgi:phenylalanyl-tRNA synthetase beta chain